jgi:hypothetical protein
LTRSIAWSPIATAQRGSLSLVDITPNGRHCRVKGNLSRTGVDIFNFHFGRDVVRRCVGCCEAADVLLELSRVDYSRKRGKLVGPSHPVLLQLELHRRACACVYWVLDFCSCELLESMMTPEFDAFFPGLLRNNIRIRESPSGFDTCCRSPAVRTSMLGCGEMVDK